MNARSSLAAVLVALAVVGGWARPARADQPRQYYSAYWQKSGGYYYKSYYYRPTAEAAYKHHHVIYYPSRPNHLYYYNPYSKKYWGRYDVVKCGYSKLAKEDQAEKLADIKEDKFPAAGEMPGMPEDESGKLKMEKPPADLPPPDLPPEESKELLKKDEFQKRNPQLAEDPPRQAFSGWCQQGGYYYCNYYCQPTAGGGYAVHRCIYYPSQPRYVYYYSPKSGKYWGRYDSEDKGYSLLADKDKGPRISEIAGDAFPKPGEMPPIPGSNDKVKMAPPPATAGLAE